MDPDRLIRVTARNDAEVLAVLEDALRTPGFAAALGEVGRLDLTAGRRLQPAAEQSGATAFVLRRGPCGQETGGQGAGGQPGQTGAKTRWRDREGGVGGKGVRVSVNNGCRRK